MEPNEWVQPILVVEKPFNVHETVVEMVAQASVAAYLLAVRMNRVDESGYTDWLSGRFTKTVRRIKLKDVEKVSSKSIMLVRGAKMEDATSHIAMAMHPTRYEDMHTVARRAQVQGLDYERWGVWAHAPQEFLISEGWPIIHINPHIQMSTGKTAAQVAHGLFGWVLKQDHADWNPSTIKWMITDSEQAWEALDEDSCSVLIHDAGLTEIEPNTLTVKVT